MDVLKFFTVRLCPWDMHLTGLLLLLLLPVDSLLQLIEDYAMYVEAHVERSSSSRILS